MDQKRQKVHILAIGQPLMHDLALALQQKGYEISGSDNQIKEPSFSALTRAGIKIYQNWHQDNIIADISTIIINSSIDHENPEVVKAKDLGLQILSFAESVYRESIDKHRIVIAGSHGKTTITAMVMHVLQYFNRNFDYVIGALPDSFSRLVKLTEDAPVLIIEGDDYVNTCFEKTAEFLNYHHHIGLISSVEWDHVNVYPTFEEYVRQFDYFADATPKAGALVYCESDNLATLISRKEREDVQRIEYDTHKHEIVNGHTYLVDGKQKYPVQVFGKHNMKNINGAKAICARLAISDEMFYQAIQTFKCPSDRLEILDKNKGTLVFKDFAYAPSKLKAATNAVKKQFPEKDLVAVYELNCCTSLSKDYLNQYKDTFKTTDIPAIYFNKNGDSQNSINPEDVVKAFNHDKLKVFTDNNELKNFLLNTDFKNKNLLLMSSGNFGGFNLKELAKQIVGK